MVAKLGRELREPPPDDDLFCHAVNEVLTFDGQLRDHVDDCGVLRVLTQPEVGAAGPHAAGGRCHGVVV